jgi:hypothetical protein
MPAPFLYLTSETPSWVPTKPLALYSHVAPWIGAGESPAGGFDWSVTSYAILEAGTAAVARMD